MPDPGSETLSAIPIVSKFSLSGNRETLRRLLPVCLFLSGGASLVLEVAWSRSLSLSLGNSHQAVATVVASMMAGLFLGSLGATRYLPRIQNLPRAYGVVEMAVGTYAALTPLLFMALPYVLGPVYSSPLVFPVLRFLLVFTILLPASAGMGATLPIMTGALSADGGESSGSVGGRLYGINTLGAFCGTLAGGFLLLPGLGLLKSTLLGGATSLAIGSLAFYLSRAVPMARRAAAPAPTPAPAGEGNARWILPLYAFSGCLAMIYEITWTRVLAPIVGTSVYSFTLILAAILGGIGIGSVALSSRRAAALDPARGFVAGQMLLGLTAFLSTWGLKAFPNLMLSAATHSAGHPALLLLWEFSLLALIVLLPGALLGALFPFASRLLRRLETEAGAEVGRVYAWNTAGSIVGSLAAGFLLVEVLGSERTLVLASAASVLLGLAGVMLSPGRRFRLVAGVAGGSLAVIFPLLVPGWDLYRMTFGINLVLRQLQQEGSGATFSQMLKNSRPPDLKVVFHKEGKTSTITVLQTGGRTFLRVDGKTDASTLPEDEVTQILLGQVPFFFSKEPQDVCVVGYGSGLTSHAVLTHPVRRVDNIEIEKQVIEGARFFDDVTFRPLADPRSRLILEDARTALMYRKDTYDIIISVPSNPWMAGVNNLFTTEFYRLARRRLKPGGILCQWVQSYEISPSSIRILQDTVAAAFPYTHLFASQLGSDMFLLASDQPVSLAPEAARLFPSRPQVAVDLERVGVRSLEDLVLRYTAPLTAPLPGTLLNTDDNSLIQYRAPLELLGFGRDRGAAGPISASPTAILQLFYPGRSEGEVFPKLARAAQARGAKGTVSAIAGLLEARGYVAQAEEVRGLAASVPGPGGAAAVDALLKQAEESIRVGDGDRAMAALQKAQAAGLRGADQNSRAGFVWLKVLHFVEAEQCLNVAASDTSSPLLYRSLAGRGAARYHIGRRREGLEDIKAAKAMNPGDPLAYLLMGLAYRDVQDIPSARRELQEGLRKVPGNPLLEHALKSLPSSRR